MAAGGVVAVRFVPVCEETFLLALVVCLQGTIQAELICGVMKFK